MSSVTSPEPIATKTLWLKARRYGWGLDAVPRFSGPHKMHGLEHLLMVGSGSGSS